MEKLYEKIIVIVILLGILFLKKHHIKEMKKDSSLSFGNIVRHYSIATYVTVSGMVMVSFVQNIGIFVTCYIVLPIIISGLYILYLGDKKIYSFYYITKGLYYFGLAIFTSVQFFKELTGGDIPRYAVGATISLAIIEGFTACIDGVKRLIDTYRK